MDMLNGVRNAFLLALVLCSALIPHTSKAATLSFSSVSGTVGNSISVPVLVSAGSGESLNAVSANISYPADKLTLTSINKTGSVITLWAQEPTFSNTNGTAALEGIVPNPGFSGSNGRVATLVFTVKAAGDATLSFSSSSILANDGLGTDILKSATPRTLSLTAAATVPTATPTTEKPVSGSTDLEPSAFPIHSTTHPDQNAWYNERSGAFSWDLPNGAQAVRLILSPSRTATPSVVYEPAIREKAIDALPEGISYLRVQYKEGGVWKGIATYKIQIDTAAPEAFQITFPHGDTGINPQPIILFNTIDGLSGIERYDVRVGEGRILATAASADSNPYTLPLQEPGPHVVLVTAYDRAGNSRTVTDTFMVEGIDAPKVTQYEEVIDYGDLVKFRGLTYPNASVEVTVTNGKEFSATELTKSNSLGDFGIVMSKRLTPGTYQMVMRTIDARNARSPLTEPITFTVHASFVTTLGFFLINNAAISLVILIVLITCAVVHVYGWRRVFKATRHLHGEQADTSRVMHRAFALLKQDLHAHVLKIRKARDERSLTKEEESFLADFEEELDEVEEVAKRLISKRTKSH